MQHQDTASALPPVARLHNSFSKLSTSNNDNTGFSHGAYASNQNPAGGYADRHPRRANITSINTGGYGQSSMNDLTTPGTAFEMNYTPLLPSQLLLGSPFQPGTPSAFASPQFASFNAAFQQNSVAHQQNQQNQIANQVQNQQGGLSPQMYQNMVSPSNYGVPQYLGGPQSPSSSFNMGNQNFGGPVQMTSALVNSSSRTVYLGNIPPETSAEEILGHVRSGQIESVRLLPDKNCAFISFLEGSSATHFHSDAILKKLSIRGQDIKVGWGKPAQVPTSVALAVQQSGASRNVYLGNLPDNVTEVELRDDLGKFGPIDTVKIVREKAIGFVHFLSISHAIKAVSQLPQEPKWQAPRRVYYGKDRCAYVSKTQQQNAAQYLGIAPGYAHVLNGADRDLISNALAQQSVAAAAVATTAGGVSNLGNRTVYLGNIHPETTIEEICNVVRGGLLHHIRYIPDKHICFVTFIDPTSAASFYALSNLQGLMIHNRRLKIGWGKHSGALPPAIALAVSGGASRNVYIGNLDESWTEERLRQDFSEYGEIELVNALREKSCAFVNFTNIANAIKAIEAIRGRDEYQRFKVNFGKDRCGNPPRQNNHNQQQQQQQQQSRENATQSPLNGNLQPSQSQSGSSNGIHHQANHPPTPSTILNAGSNNPLTMFLNQVSAQQAQQEQDAAQTDPYSVAALQQQQQQVLVNQQAALYGTSSAELLAVDVSQQGHNSSYSQGINVMPTTSNVIGGLLAPARNSQHARAVSLPLFSQEIFGNGNGQGGQQHQHQQQQSQQGGLQQPSHRHQQSSFSGGTGFGGFGNPQWPLTGWAEEETTGTQ